MPGPMLTHDQIESTVVSEAQNADTYVRQNVATKRTENWDRYYGKPLGNEKKGRSQYMARDVMDTIEWILPTLIRLFASGDTKMELIIEGQPAWVGKGLMRKIIDDLSDNEDTSLFMLFYTWFKDALVSNTAFVKAFWVMDYEDRRIQFPRVTPQQMDKLNADPDVEVAGYDTEMASPFDVVFTNVRVKIRAVKENRCKVANVPHWEFKVHQNARHVNDEWGKGQETRVSLDYLRRLNRSKTEKGKQAFFPGLEKVETKHGLPHSGSYTQGVQAATGSDSEEAAYREETVMPSTETPVPGDKKGAKHEGKLTEWYTRLDTNQDGFEEDITAWVFDHILLKWEENKEGFIPFAALSPILDCYKFYGIAFADLLVELQNLKTMIIRRILDNFDFTNSGRWFVSPRAGVDVRALLDNIPGDVIMGEPDGVKNDSPQPFHPSVLQLVEYVDTVKENRTGSTRYNQGMSADTLNKTASGMAMLQGAAQQRIDLVGRIFAETGLKDLYKKIARLYQKYVTRPFTVKVRGKDRQITPEMLRGKIRCKVNMGVENQGGMIEAQKIERLFAFLASVSKMYPGLLGPKQVHNLATRYVASLGFGQTEEFVNELESFVKHIKQMIEGRQKTQQAAVKEKQRENDRADNKLRLEKYKADLAAAANDRERLSRVMTENKKLLQKEKNQAREALVELKKIRQTGVRQAA